MRASLFLPSPSITWAIQSRPIRWEERVASMREYINTYGILVRKPERKIALVNPGCRWKDETKNEITWEGWTILTL